MYGDFKKTIQAPKFNSQNEYTTKIVQFNQQKKWNIVAEFPRYNRLPKKGNNLTVNFKSFKNFTSYILTICYSTYGYETMYNYF
jgi:hypothetical protein